MLVWNGRDVSEGMDTMISTAVALERAGYIGMTDDQDGARQVWGEGGRVQSFIEMTGQVQTAWASVPKRDRGECPCVTLGRLDNAAATLGQAVAPGDGREGGKTSTL